MLRRVAPHHALAQYELVPEGWTTIVRGSDVGGWDRPSVAEAQRARWPEFVAACRAPNALGIAHEVHRRAALPTENPHAHNLVATFGYVLARASRSKERLSVLDWGSGIGHYAVLARELLPDVELDYHCYDVPALAEVGREVQPEVTFHDDERCLDSTYDLVVASGSVQYDEDWRGRLRRLAGAAGRFLYVARLPVVEHAPSFVMLQRAYWVGYETEYIGWALNRGELLSAAARAGLEVEREFISGGVAQASDFPETARLRGFLLRPAA